MNLVIANFILYFILDRTVRPQFVCLAALSEQISILVSLVRISVQVSFLIQDPSQHWPYLEAALYTWSAVAESLAEEEECPILTQFLAKLPVLPYNNNMRVSLETTLLEFPAKKCCAEFYLSVLYR